MIPHVHVHRRRHDYRRCGGEVKCCQKVAGDSLSEVGQNVSRRRRDHEPIDGLSDRNVLDRGVDVGLMSIARREHTGNDFFSRERGEGEGT